MKHIFFAAIVALSVSSCALPMNSSEFEKAVSGTPGGKVNQITLHIPFDKVIANLKGPIENCMSYSTPALISSHGMVGPAHSLRTHLTILKPGRAKLITQDKQTGGIMILSEPEGGLYIFSADITSESKTTTVIVMRYHVLGPSEFADHMKNWASGEDQSCHHGLF